MPDKKYNIKGWCCAFVSIIYSLLCSNNALSEIVRDQEIEDMVRELSEPIFRAAEVNPEDMSIYIDDNKQVNAFTIGRNIIIVNLGLIKFAKDDPNILLGVMAHEMGHVKLDHINKKIINIEAAKKGLMLGQALNLLAMATEQPKEVNYLISSGGHNLITQLLLNNSREQEEEADNLAVQYMRKAGYNIRGMITFFENAASQEKILGHNKIPFLFTHPLSSQRLERMSSYAKEFQDVENLSEEKITRYNRIVAKIDGFINDPQKTLKSVQNNHSLDNEYIRAISLYRRSDIENSIKSLDKILVAEPDNPYLHELKGEMLYASGDIEESIVSFDIALNIKPGSYIIEREICHALIATGEKQPAIRALGILKKLRKIEPHNTSILSQIAMSYGTIGNNTMSYITLLEKSILDRDQKQAKKFLTLASSNISKDSEEERLFNEISHVYKNFLKSGI